MITSLPLDAGVEQGPHLQRHQLPVDRVEGRAVDRVAVLADRQRVPVPRCEHHQVGIEPFDGTSPSFASGRSTPDRRSRGRCRRRRRWRRGPVQSRAGPGHPGSATDHTGGGRVVVAKSGGQRRTVEITDNEHLASVGHAVAQAHRSDPTARRGHEPSPGPGAGSRGRRRGTHRRTGANAATTVACGTAPRRNETTPRR